MAQLVLSRVGAAVGSRLLPRGISALGARVTGAAIGRTLGALAGSAIDSRFLNPPIEGPRIRDFHLMESREGSPVPLVYGRMRVGGQVIWAADFRENRTTRSGGKGGPRTREYSYTVSFAVGLCEGEAVRVSRCWANGEPFDLSKVTWRFYPGNETQEPDPLIEAIEGVGNAPAYRGLSYIVFEDLPVDEFGARLPQFSFEVLRPAGGGADRLESVARAVNLIPGAGEFSLATSVVRRVIGPGRETSENQHGPEAIADFLASLDRLEAELPNVRRVNLVVSWFGDDLRAGTCRIRPGVDRAHKETRPLTWSVAGKSRAEAWVVSQTDGRANYGGTPSDASVIQAIQELRSRGFHVTLYPFLLMDVPPGNALPDPYGGMEQAAFPWRGRITCHPAPGRAGSPDGTQAAVDQVAAFFAGPDGYSAFIRRCASMAVEAGGVDGFLIGTELVGLTRVRGPGGSYPAVTALASLAGEVRGIIGPGPELSYAADWTEYGAHVLANGDVAFPLDPLWADPAISHVALDWYPPMSDWRPGEGHLDAEIASGPHDPDYLSGGVAGGEAYDWFYATPQGRVGQQRLPITDGAFGEPWIFRQKDIRGWWLNPHHPRTGGQRSATPTAWLPGMKPVRFAEFGAPAVDNGANQPNVFYDPKSAESALPHFSSGARDDLIQRRAIEAFCRFWADPSNNPVSAIYGGPMIPEDGVSLWAWDARPFPAFPVRGDVWGDGANWRLGHWLNGRVGASLLPDVLADLCQRGGVACEASEVTSLVHGYRVDGQLSLREAIEPLLAGLGVTTTERGEVLAFRGAGIPTELDPEDLIQADAGAAILQVRGGLEAAAVSIRLGFVDNEADHAPGLVAVEGPPGSVWADLALPIAMNRDEARERAAALVDDIAAARRTARFALSEAAASIESGDMISLNGECMRVASVELDGAFQLEARAAPTSLYVPVAAPLPAYAPSAPLAVEPDVVVVDPPALPGVEDDDRPLAFAFSEPWLGPVQVSIASAEDSARVRGEVLRPCRIGTLESTLSPFPAGRWQEADIWVRLHGGDLASVPDLAVHNGANACLVGTATGWELVQFARAEQVSPDLWKLSRLLRAQQGTDADASAGSPLGARVLFLDGAAGRLELAAWERELGLTVRAWREMPGEPTAVEAPLTAEGRALREWSPAHLRASWTGEDLQLSWIRRGRTGGDAWDGGEPPLRGEARYRVTVWVAGEARRTWDTGLPEALYRQSEIAVDAPNGGAATIEVAQLGPDSRPGAAARLAVTLPS